MICLDLNLSPPNVFVTSLHTVTGLTCVFVVLLYWNYLNEVNVNQDVKKLGHIHYVL